MFGDKNNSNGGGDSLDEDLFKNDLLDDDNDDFSDLLGDNDSLFVDEDTDDEYVSSNEDSVEFVDDTEEEDFSAPASSNSPPEEKLSAGPVFGNDYFNQDATEEEPQVFHQGNVMDAGRASTPHPSSSANYKNNARKLTEALSDESSELHMNGPTEILQKKEGGIVKLDISFDSMAEYNRAIDEVILEYVQDKPRIADHKSYIEGILFWDEDKTVPPVVARVHVILPPASKAAQVTVAKKARWRLSLDDLVERGSLTYNMGEFIKSCSRGQVNILLSGVSGSGKTTLVEAIAEHFDANDRVVVIEDTSELQLNNAFDVSYLEAHPAAPGRPQSEEIGLEWLVRQANRMRPSRIIIGELRGGEASEFLIAANSGADGSMTTIHAESPRRALSQMVNLVLKGGGQASERTVKRDISETLQIVIQTSLIDGKHIISSIEEISNTIREQTGAMTSQNIFEYDRQTKRFLAKGRPSEDLVTYMEHRGETVNNDWFK